MNPRAPAWTPSSPSPILSEDSITTTITKDWLASGLLPGTNYVLPWDIEKSGPRTDKHSMLALGGAVIRVFDDKIMARFRVFMRMEEGHDFSEHCRSDYWYNWARFPTNKLVLERIEKEGVAAKDGIQAFATWLDRQERAYTKQGVALVTDNPASDGAWVSHYFQKYLDRNPIYHRYGEEPQYRRLHHSNAFGRALSLDDGRDSQWLDRLRTMGIEVPDESLHDHDPLHDAIWIGKLYAACLRFTSHRRSWIAQQQHHHRHQQQQDPAVSVAPRRPHST